MSLAGLSETDEETLTELLEGARRGGYVIGRPVALFKRVVRPDLTWDDAVPGLAFPPLEYRIGRTAVARYLRLAARVVGTPTLAEPETVPPMMFADEPMQCIATLFGRSGRFHAGHRMTCLRPIPVGALVRSRGRVSDRFERSGRRFVTVACEVSIVEGDEEIPAVTIEAVLLP